MLILHSDSYYESRKPELDLGACKNCLRFMWNNEKKSFLGRTSKEWGNNLNLHSFELKIVIFY